MSRNKQSTVATVGEPAPPIDAGLAPTRTPRRAPAKRVQLSGIEHVAKEIASVYRAARAGEIAVADAARFTYMLGELVKALRAGDIERRIAQLEAAGAATNLTIEEDEYP